jgi:hypothetical protein
MAKVLNKKTPDLNHFRPYLEAAYKNFTSK